MLARITGARQTDDGCGYDGRTVGHRHRSDRHEGRRLRPGRSRARRGHRLDRSRPRPAVLGGARARQRVAQGVLDRADRPRFGGRRREHRRCGSERPQRRPLSPRRGRVAVRPAILATDARARRHAAELGAGDRGSRLLELTGQLPMAATPSVLLRWLREHEPETLTRARWLLSSTDWLRLRLTGTAATDPTMAAAAFVSLDSPGWSLEALELCDLRGPRGEAPAHDGQHCDRGPRERRGVASDRDPGRDSGGGRRT